MFPATRLRLVSVVAAIMMACALAACGAAPATPSVAPAASVAASAAAASPLAGVWQLQHFEYMSGKVVAASQPASYTVEFLPDGRLRVKADCNSGAGTYKTSEDRLTIEGLAMTEKACPAGSLADQFVQGLTNAVSYVLTGGDLTISMKYDAGDMVLRQ